MCRLYAGEVGVGDIQPVYYFKQLGYLFGCGIFMHTVNKGNIVFPCGLCGSLVGAEHKFLDDKLRSATLTLLNVCADLVFVDGQLAFGSIDLGSASFQLVGCKYLRQLLHEEDRVRKSRILFRNISGDL